MSPPWNFSENSSVLMRADCPGLFCINYICKGGNLHILRKTCCGHPDVFLDRSIIEVGSEGDTLPFGWWFRRGPAIFSIWIKIRATFFFKTRYWWNVISFDLIWQCVQWSATIATVIQAINMATPQNWFWKRLPFSVFAWCHFLQKWKCHWRNLKELFTYFLTFWSAVGFGPILDCDCK